jgi:hypothetical protein
MNVFVHELYGLLRSGRNQHNVGSVITKNAVSTSHDNTISGYLADASEFGHMGLWIRSNYSSGYENSLSKEGALTGFQMA